MSNLEPSIDSSKSSAGTPVPNGSPTDASPPTPPLVPPPPPTSHQGRRKQPAATGEPPLPPPPTGVGSAKGVRWRGELDELPDPAATKPKPQSSAKPAAKPSASAPVAPPKGESAEVDADSAAAEPSGEAEEPKEDLSKKAPPWLISMIVHLILLVILGLISTPVGEGLGTVMMVLGDSTGDSFDALAEFSIDPVDALSDAESEFIEDAPIDFDTPLEFDSLKVDQPKDPTEANIGVGPMVQVTNPMFGGRRGATKAELMKRYGGTPQTAEAVDLGLAWLKRQQMNNGAWSMRGPYRDGVRNENKIAATSMALLAFMGDGNTHREGTYADEVLKGLKFLTKEQRRDGFFCQKVVSGDDEQAYAQAQATIAVCEAYAMTGDSWLKPYAQAALDYCSDAQSATGGWRYRFRDIEGDLSVTGWYVMAFQSGRQAPDLKIDDKVWYGIDRFMDTVSLGAGSAYGYLPGYGETPSMSAEGLLIRQYTGWQREHRSMQRGVKNLLDNYMFDIDQSDVYYWYYATQVLHHYGTSAWSLWNNRMREALPQAQTKRGREKGSWAPQGDKWGDRAGGRLYTTCLSLYCLEVYYRHMPLYDMWEETP
ncbi:prenyltransferase/squalene oxidase repeat-containing protein [Crateriforma conspicua]|uniref:Squalene cyclase C-terminal domain-containing protein n=1 Tax=Crateriforma conspicua TaxID=2527996 RepID=A0A5C6FR46_9PLAN|nr:prenyltransferase/squalene oxidase repeat-containing protein [Crateriforma conspicua]TWU63038.1 hypothetical protein V7x_47750 [Crateriforma conspicua]